MHLSLKMQFFVSTGRATLSNEMFIMAVVGKVTVATAAVPSQISNQLGLSSSHLCKNFVFCSYLGHNLLKKLVPERVRVDWDRSEKFEDNH
jgi:hypothetical protein